MAEQPESDAATGGAATAAPPPPLPAKLNDLRPPMWVGTAAWFAAFCVLLFVAAGSPAFWVTLAGWLLGLTGLLISAWQRSASRRGSRGAQTGV